MGAFAMQYRTGGPVPEGVGLLISILLRYPEVGSVRYVLENQVLKFTFTVRGPRQAAALPDKLPLALEVFHQLEERQMRVCSVAFTGTDQVGTVVITRDVDSMTQNEVGLIVDLVKGEFGQDLVCEEGELPEEELVFQEEMIGHMLESIRNLDIDKNVIAVREEGRVLLFRN